jgi:Ca2+-binding EF-hand superfamily protein
MRFFQFLDKNQDNYLNVGEARQFLQNNRSIPLENNSWFLRMDQNNDGFISPNEFDEDLNRNMFRN